MPNNAHSHEGRPLPFPPRKLKDIVETAALQPAVRAGRKEDEVSGVDRGAPSGHLVLLLFSGVAADANGGGGNHVMITLLIPSAWGTSAETPASRCAQEPAVAAIESRHPLRQRAPKTKTMGKARAPPRFTGCATAGVRATCVGAGAWNVPREFRFLSSSSSSSGAGRAMVPAARREPESPRCGPARCRSMTHSLLLRVNRPLSQMGLFSCRGDQGRARQIV